MVALATACGGGSNTVDALVGDAVGDSKTAKDITSFSFLSANNSDLAVDVTATISGTDITASVRFGQSVVGALKATFSTTGASVTVGGIAQVNSVTPNNYMSPVIYRVTAIDGSTKDYAVTIVTPGLLPRVDFAPGTTPNSVAVGDLNGDGKPDFAIANSNSPTVSVFLNTTAPNATTPSFSAKTDVPSGSVSLHPFFVSIGDLNGDGKPDLVVGNVNFGNNPPGLAGTVSVFLNTTATGATTPSFSANTDFASAGPGTSPYAMAIGDLNADGKPDLAVASNTSSLSSGISVFLNTTAPNATTPSFSPKVDFASAAPDSVVIGDFNGDGKPDLAVANSIQGTSPVATVSVFLNTTATGALSPSFAAKADFTTGLIPDVIVAIGDFNGDAKPDLAVPSDNSASVSVFLNTTASGATTPTFAAKVDFTTGFGPLSTIATDLNGDGKPDLLVANLRSNNVVGTVSVFLNTTATGAMTPSFAARVDFTIGLSPSLTSSSVATGDFNGDGKPDVAVASASSNTVSVLLAQ